MEPFIGQIMLFAGNFAPRGFALCEGQLLPINQNSALFSILGTTYGGDGRTTFGLPDLRGRAPIQQGTGPGLTPYTLGEKSGAEHVTLTTNQLPSHNHSFGVYNGEANSGAPVNAALATAQPFGTEIYHSGDPNETAEDSIIGRTGGGQSVDIRQPTLALNYCIALVGVYPSRS